MVRKRVAVLAKTLRLKRVSANIPMSTTVRGRATAASPPATSTSTPARGGRHQEASEWGGGSAKTEGVHEHGVRVREPDLLIDPSSLSGGRELQVEAGRWGGASGIFALDERPLAHASHGSYYCSRPLQGALNETRLSRARHTFSKVLSLVTNIGNITRH
jgi:hypothetical protein